MTKPLSAGRLKYALLVLTVLAGLVWAFSKVGSGGYLGSSFCITFGSGSISLCHSALPLICHGFRTDQVTTGYKPLFSLRRRNYWELSIPLFIPFLFVAGVAGASWCNDRPVNSRSRAKTSLPLPWRILVWCMLGLQLIPVLVAFVLMAVLLIIETDPVCVAIPFLTLLAAGGLREVLRWRQFAPGHCRRCGYNLTANTSGVCPECGQSCPTDRTAGNRSTMRDER